MGKVRGVWGSGDSHGNNVKLLSLVSNLIKLTKNFSIISGASMYASKKYFPEYVNEEGVTDKGKELLSKLDYLGITNLINL